MLEVLGKVLSAVLLLRFPLGYLLLEIGKGLTWLVANKAGAVFWTIILSILGTIILNVAIKMTGSVVVGWIIIFGLYIVYLNIANRQTTF